MQRNNIKIVFALIACLVCGIAPGGLAAEKARISVLRFTNNTQAYWWTASTAADLQDMLINELNSTKVFNVLSRQELYLLLEQKFTDAIPADTKAKQKTGRIKTAKYFVAATIAAFEENTNGGSNPINFPGFSSREEQKTAYIAVDLKVIDGETGAVIDARIIEATDTSCAKQNGTPANPSVLYGSLNRQEKTTVGRAIRNSITEITSYLECALITRDEDCLKKYATMETKRKEKNKPVIQLEN